MKYPYLETATKFRQIVDKIYVDGDKALRSKELFFNISWYPVYKTLYQSNDMFSVNQLAARTGYTHIAVKNVLYALRDKNLLIQEVDPEDKRSKLNSLTLKGKKLYEKTKPIWDQLELALSQVFDPINPNLVYDIETLKEQFQQKGLFELFENPNSTTYRIEPLTQNDVTAWHSLIANAVLSEHDRILFHEEKTLLQQPFECIYPSGGFVWLLKQKQQTIGSLAIVNIDKIDTELCFWYVTPNARQRGLGYQLLKKGLSWARTMYKKEVIIQLQSDENSYGNLLLRNSFTPIKSSKNLALNYKKHIIFHKYI